MIGKLHRRLTLLVIGALALVTVGIVLSVHVINLRNIDRNAAAALQVLSENQGRRPDLDRQTSPDAGRLPEASPPPKPEDDPGFQGRPGIDMRGGNSLASLSNAYTVHRDADGSVSAWSSDREDLYDDDEVRALAAAAADDQLSFADVAAEELKAALLATDLNTLTPLEAMNLLFELQKKARG